MRGMLLFWLCILILPSAFANSFYYEGEITDAKNQAFFKEYSKGHIGRLRITSAGGEIGAGMSLGQFVYEKSITVEVDDYCMSSCANYVFTAALRKEIDNTDIIGLHGGALSLKKNVHYSEDLKLEIEKFINTCDLSEQGKLLKDSLFVLSDSYIEAECQFYQMIGVSNLMVLIGDLYAQDNNLDILYWQYSIPSLSLLGVSNVYVQHRDEATNRKPSAKSISIPQEVVKHYLDSNSAKSTQWFLPIKQDGFVLH